jgi:hypothetical protein
MGQSTQSVPPDLESVGPLPEEGPNGLVRVGDDGPVLLLGEDLLHWASKDRHVPVSFGTVCAVGIEHVPRDNSGSSGAERGRDTEQPDIPAMRR